MLFLHVAGREKSSNIGLSAIWRQPVLVQTRPQSITTPSPSTATTRTPTRRMPRHAPHFKRRHVQRRPHRTSICHLRLCLHGPILLIATATLMTSGGSHRHRSSLNLQHRSLQMTTSIRTRTPTTRHNHSSRNHHQQNRHSLRNPRLQTARTRTAIPMMQSRKPSLRSSLRSSRHQCQMVCRHSSCCRARLERGAP